MNAIKFVNDTEARIEGLAIPFGGPKGGRDLDNETFTRNTDFAMDWYPDGRPILFDHGVTGDVGMQVVGRQVKAEVRDEGVWVEGVLNQSHRYWERIRDMVKDGRLYFSSGSFQHLARKDAEGRITRWPWAELSLTPTPANPYAVASVKSHTIQSLSLGIVPHLPEDDAGVAAVVKAAVLEALDERALAEQRGLDEAQQSAARKAFAAAWWDAQRVLANTLGA